MSSLWVALCCLAALVPARTLGQRCGCEECTDLVWNAQATTSFTCGERIETEIADDGLAIQEACAFAGERYPLTCGPCHPEKCDGKAPPLCNCGTCTVEVWNTTANGFSCGERVIFVIDMFGEIDSCRRVAEQYQEECGLCHPDCRAQPTFSPTKRPPVVETKMPTSTPIQRISIPPTFAPLPIDPTLRPTPIMPTQSPITVTPEDSCGCFACTEDVLSSVALGFSCRERISFLQTEEGGLLPELEACQIVAEAFPTVCGPVCHPTLCATFFPSTSPSQSNSEPCGCYECTESVLSRTAAGFTCQERIQFLQSPMGDELSELEACDFVGSGFVECSGCWPKVCDGRASDVLDRFILAGLVATSVVTMLVMFQL